MTRRIIIAVAWGLAGLAIAGGLMAGAFALAGDEIGRPATPVLPGGRPAHDGDDRTHSPGPTRSEAPSPSASADDHGGDRPGGDNGTVDDHGGSGSDDSSSGSGSDDSGSGSNSGSDDSGSGSGDD